MGLGGGLVGRGAPGPVVSVPPPSLERGFAFRDALGKGGATPPQSPYAGPRADGGAGVRVGGCSPPRFPAALFPNTFSSAFSNICWCICSLLTRRA